MGGVRPEVLGLVVCMGLRLLPGRPSPGSVARADGSGRRLPDRGRGSIPRDGPPKSPGLFIEWTTGLQKCQTVVTTFDTLVTELLF